MSKYAKTKEQIAKEAWLFNNTLLDLLATPHSTLTCIKCKDWVFVPHVNDYQPVVKWMTRHYNGKRVEYSKTLKTRNELVKWFQDQHYAKCSGTKTP